MRQCDFDWIEKRFNKTGIDHLALLEDIIQDALLDDMGIVSKAEVEKIE